jgi:aldehyde dehydrogenase (NAD+)
MPTSTASTAAHPDTDQRATREDHKAWTAERLQALFAQQRAALPQLRQCDARQRIEKLRRLQKAVLERRQAIAEALMEDFRKHPAEVEMTEVLPVTSEIKHIAAHLSEWMAPRKVATPVSLIGTRSEIRVEPKGQTLIISPWNFPINLSLIPMAASIAAGNAVVLKPSELAPASAAVLAELVESTFDPSEVAVCPGNVEVAKRLLDLPFHHIFFTGSPRVGRLVMAAAAQHLSGITLELGGKSPVLVDRHANLDEAARKVAWGKGINAGQTCIAPDYVLVHEDQMEPFIDKLDAQWTVQYGQTDAARMQSDSFARIINQHHVDRLSGLLQDALDQGAVVNVGGTVDPEVKFVAPTVLTGLQDGMRILEEEIFGPLLPILPYQHLDDALAYVNERPKPLALYAFSKRRSSVERILSETQSGGVTVNDTIIHFFNPNMPFGGINNSGLGGGHGRFGFEAFSHLRSVMHQQTKYSVNKLLYPPYTAQTDRLLDLSIKLF